MLRKLYLKNELLFSIGCIVVYVLVMGNLQANFGAGSIYSAAGLTVITAILLLFFTGNRLFSKYGLNKPAGTKQCLYFIPLLLMATVNLWFGFRLHYSPAAQLLAVITMTMSGITEELIFRGLLFRAIEKNSLKEAVIISSLTFGAGHIINLFTGGAGIETVLQVLYAAAIGFAFVMVLLKSGSILPCIVTHSFINVSAEFSVPGSTAAGYVQAVFLMLAAGGYALYLYKKVPARH